jgi:hypothetical protein
MTRFFTWENRFATKDPDVWSFTKASEWLEGGFINDLVSEGAGITG